MPHIIVKLYPGRSEEQKKDFARRVVEDAKQALGAGDDSLSVAFEEVKPADWRRDVYDRDIKPQMAKLYKKPGYGPDDL